MTLIRRAILALALIAGITPAFAQAPGPVPALPDTERRTTYSISASTCNCAVGFALYGDSTDYANWLTVWVNGVQMPQAGNWSIASPSGSLATLPRPITDAVLTFTVAQTGTVQIVGARRPRRTSQFSENRGVAARDMNQVLSDLEAQVREIWDRQARTVQAPPGDTLNILPALSGRASMNACFDSGGNLTSCVGASSGSFAAGNGILFTGVNPTTITNNIQAGAGIKFTGTNPIVVSAGGSNSNYVQLSDYGITCDGSTDWRTQLQTAITASAGKTLFIPAGPDCLTSTSLALPSNIHITGAGREVSTIRSTSANPVFIGTDITNVQFDHFWCKGTDAVVSWTASSFGCLKIIQDGSSVSIGSNFNIQNMKFSNFNSSYWNYFSAAGSTFGFSAITFSNNYILSATGDIPTDASNANNNNIGLVIYSGSGGNGRVDSTIIQNNRIEATALCFPIILYGNHYKPQIENNLINGAGQISPLHCSNADLSTQNSYGIAIYDINGDGNPATNFLVSGNTIINPYATGIYIVGDGNPAHTTATYNTSGSIISNNLIDGQTSQSDSALPRAGIVVSLSTDIDIIGNKIRNSFGGIAAVGQMTGLINIEGNTCTSGMANGASVPYCYRLSSGSNGSSNTSRHILKANYGELTSTTSNDVIRLGSTTGARFNDVEISDNTINAGWNGLQAPSQFVAGSFVVKNNKFGGASNNQMMNVSSLTGSPVAIIDNVFDSIGGVNGYGLLAQSSTIHMSNNKFMNRASGTVPMLNLVGTCGTINGTQFNAVTQLAQVQATSLGTANPSGCTLNYKDFVENLTPAEAGAAASKYVEYGWLHAATAASTVHLPQRALTGN